MRAFEIEGWLNGKKRMVKLYRAIFMLGKKISLGRWSSEKEFEVPEFPQFESGKRATTIIGYEEREIEIEE